MVKSLLSDARCCQFAAFLSICRVFPSVPVLFYFHFQAHRRDVDKTESKCCSRFQNNGDIIDVEQTNKQTNKNEWIDNVNLYPELGSTLGKIWRLLPVAPLEGALRQVIIHELSLNLVCFYFPFLAALISQISPSYFLAPG